MVTFFPDIAHSHFNIEGITYLILRKPKPRLSDVGVSCLGAKPSLLQASHQQHFWIILDVPSHKDMDDY